MSKQWPRRFFYIIDYAPRKWGSWCRLPALPWYDAWTVAKRLHHEGFTIQVIRCEGHWVELGTNSRMPRPTYLDRPVPYNLAEVSGYVWLPIIKAKRGRRA